MHLCGTCCRMILTHIMAKHGADSQLFAAALFSVPWNFAESQRMLEEPINKLLFNRHFVHDLHVYYLRYLHPPCHLSRLPLPFHFVPIHSISFHYKPFLFVSFHFVASLSVPIPFCFCAFPFSFQLSCFLQLYK